MGKTIANVQVDENAKLRDGITFELSLSYLPPDEQAFVAIQIMRHDRLAWQIELHEILDLYSILGGGKDHVEFADHVEKVGEETILAQAKELLLAEGRIEIVNGTDEEDNDEAQIYFHYKDFSGRLPLEHKSLLRYIDLT